MSQEPAGQRVLHRGLGRPVQILLVEDSPSDAAMTAAALRESRVINHLHIVGDGEAAMAYLRKEGDHQSRSTPDLILLDLNLPRKDGREVLEEIKHDSAFVAIPVIILTTSAAERDIVRSYTLHASGYITKPVGYDAFEQAIRGIEDWLSMVQLPNGRLDAAVPSSGAGRDAG